MQALADCPAPVAAYVPAGHEVHVLPAPPSAKYVPGAQHTAVPAELQCVVWPAEHELEHARYGAGEFPEL